MKTTTIKYFFNMFCILISKVGDVYLYGALYVYCFIVICRLGRELVDTWLMNATNVFQFNLLYCLIEFKTILNRIVF